MNDDQSYHQHTENDADLASAFRAIRQSLEETKQGQGRSMREFVEELAAQHDISLVGGQPGVNHQSTIANNRLN